MARDEQVIRVRWQSRNMPDRRPCHGFEFYKSTGLNTLFPDESECPDYYAAWDAYVVHLAETNEACLRIWVDEEIVWDWEHDWYYSMSDLRKRIWGSDGGPPPQAKNVQDAD